MEERPALKDDFYSHVNFDWLNDNPIPDEYTKWGNFNVLFERNQERLKEMLEEEPVTDEQKKLNILWKKGHNIEELNNSNKTGLYGHLINNDYDDTDLNQLIVSWLKYNLCFLFDVESYTDLKNSDRNVLYFDVPSLSLPDRDYYLNEKMKDKQDGFKVFLESFLKHCNISCDVNSIYDFEEKIANVKLSKTDRRNPMKLYNKFTYFELFNSFPNIPWKLIFAQFKFPTDDVIIITEPEYFKFLNNYLGKCYEDEKIMSNMKNYYKYRLAKTASPYIDDETYKIYFDFFGRQLMGQKEPRQRWKRVLGTVDNMLGEVLSKAYVQKYFNEEQKDLCMNMVKEICTTFENRIKKLEWMSDVTKEKALYKLSKFTVKIGYPDKWTDFSNLHIQSSLSYFENILECYRWGLQHNLDELYKPVDKDKWSMNAHDINAYYSPTKNQIVFPAGILQEPFFSSKQTLAENLGGIGAVIGHEITHGFDDKGRLYDADGNLNDWWTEEDGKLFDERSKKLEELFASYQFYGIPVNGKLTLGENIADLGGLTLSLETLEKSTQPEELFKQIESLFYQWAKIWRCNITNDALQNQLLTDPHSPTKLRVNAILRNLDKFYEIFNIGKTDEMYLNPNLRSKIW